VGWKWLVYCQVNAFGSLNYTLSCAHGINAGRVLPDSASSIRATFASGFAALFMLMNADNRSPDAAPAESGNSRLNPATLIS